MVSHHFLGHIDEKISTLKGYQTHKGLPIAPTGRSSETTGPKAHLSDSQLSQIHTPNALKIHILPQVVRSLTALLGQRGFCL